MCICHVVNSVFHSRRKYNHVYIKKYTPKHLHSFSTACHPLRSDCDTVSQLSKKTDFIPAFASQSKLNILNTFSKLNQQHCWKHRNYSDRHVPLPHLFWLLLSFTDKVQPLATSSLHDLPTANLHPHTFHYSLPSLPLQKTRSLVLCASHPTTCLLDPISSHLLQEISPTLLPALTHIINTFLNTGTFSKAFKKASTAQKANTQHHDWKLQTSVSSKFSV